MAAPLLPTATASDHKRGLRKEYVTGEDGKPLGSKDGIGLTLPEMAWMGLLTTPAQGRLPEETSRSSLLNPLFVSEMMGFPLTWLTLPFSASRDTGGDDG